MKKKAICGICPDKCWVDVTIEDGKIVKVAPDKENPLGRLCPRGALASEIIYSNKRILTPSIRTGERGEGKFREASWDEALDLAASNFLEIKEKYGAQALVSYYGTSGREDSTRIGFTGEGSKLGFFEHLGSPNDMSCGATCFTSANILAPVTTCGVPQPAQGPDLQNTELIFIWGKNPKTDSGALKFYEKIKAAKERGAKVIVIDPRKKGMGEEADLWVPIIPGSDGALAIAMLKIIVESRRYDDEFVEKWSLGFDELSEYLKTVTLEELSQFCGVSVGTIKELTDLICSTTKAVYFSYTGIEYQLSAVQNCRAVHILWALTGKLDVEGGMLIKKDKLGVYPLAEIGESQRIGEREFPFFTRMLNTGQFSLTPEAVLRDDPYPVRGFYFAAASPMTTYPDKKVWEEVYQKLDFIAVNERFMSEDAKFADVIFPATTYYENAAIVNTPAGPAIREKVIDPVGESKNDLHILKALAQKLGFGEAYPEEDDESTLLWMLDGDADLLANLRSGKRPPAKEHECKKWESGHLRADGKPGFPTPTGKFEISSTYIKECGYVGHPVYKDIRSVDELGDAESYPMMMTTGARSSVRFASFGPNIPEIAKIEPAPLVDIDRSDAEKLNISQGEWTQVETVFGKKAFKANVCDMASGCIHVPFGGGSSFMPEDWANGNINEICSLNYHDELSGFLLYKSMPCRVSKVQG